MLTLTCILGSMRCCGTQAVGVFLNACILQLHVHVWLEGLRANRCWLEVCRTGFGSRWYAKQHLKSHRFYEFDS